MSAQSTGQTASLEGETRGPDYGRPEPSPTGASETQGLLNGTGAAANRQVNQPGNSSVQNPL